MSAPYYSRRAGRIVGRTTSGIEAHARYYRACANDEPDEPFAVARGIVNGVLLGVPCWFAVAAIVGVCWWAFECFVRGTC